MIIAENLEESISSPREVVKVVRDVLDLEPEHDQDKEHFWCIGVNAKNRIIYIDLVSLGTLSNAPIHPRESFRLAIMKGCASVIFVHNHPSGNPSPSSDDYAITDRLRKAGEILGIAVLDHVIIGDRDRYFAFNKGGKFL